MMKHNSKAFMRRSFPVFMLVAASFLASCAVMYLQGVREQAKATLRFWNDRAMRSRSQSSFRDSRTDYVPINICPEALAMSNYAIAAMITSPKQGDNKKYQLSAAKLAVSIKTWSPNLDVDMIMIVAVAKNDLGMVDSKLLTKSGWTLCHVGAIPSPPVKKRNRFLDSDMFSRLLLWKLYEYRAVVSLDLDLIVANDISKFFSFYYPLMQAKNASLAAAKDALSRPCTNPSSSQNTFNAGVMLIIPSASMFDSLNRKVNAVDYDLDWAEQGLLNSIYPEGTYLELPFTMNAHLAEKHCNSTRWREIEDDIVIFHYTVVKGWSMQVLDPASLLMTGFGFNIFGAILWDALALCYVWELVSTSVEQ